jgi:hypothetical protein
VLWWIFVLTLFYASARWTALGTAVGALIFIIGAVGLLIMAKVGFLSVFVRSIFEIPILLARGIFGIIKVILLA